MKLNKTKFHLDILKHQKLLGVTAYNLDSIERKDEDFNKLLSKIVGQGEDLAIARSGFKCENPNCFETKNLQIHHLIMRKTKEIIPPNIYLSQRNYFANMVILCATCHKKIHKITEGKNNKDLVLSDERKDKIIKKYYKKVDIPGETTANAVL